MQTLFKDFMKELRPRKDPEGLRGVMATASAELGITSFAYLGFPTSCGRERPLLLATYPRDWTDLYLHRRYQMIDPVIQSVAKSFDPFHWAPEIVGIASEEQESLFREAGQHGVSNGYTVPIHDTMGRFASVNFAAGDRDPAEFRATIERNGPLIHLLGIYFHAHVRNQAEALLGRDRPSLSPREVECLHWCGKGKSHSDIATILGLSRRTVKFHLENAMRKLGVATARQAVLRAAVLGFVEV